MKVKNTKRIAAIFIAATVIVSCSKSQLSAPPQLIASKYQLIIDWYNLDTTILVKRTTWWQDTLIRPELKKMIEDAPDMWWLMCETDKNPLHIEHWYYMRDGKKIHQSKFPISK